MYFFSDIRWYYWTFPRCGSTKLFEYTGRNWTIFKLYVRNILQTVSNTLTHGYYIYRQYEMSCHWFAVNFFAGGLHARTAVARLPLRQPGFLVLYLPVTGYCVLLHNYWDVMCVCVCACVCVCREYVSRSHRTKNCWRDSISKSFYSRKSSIRRRVLGRLNTRPAQLLTQL